MLIPAVSSSPSSFVRTAITLLLIFQHPPGVCLHCYHVQIKSFRTTETPEYRFHMQLNNNQTLSSVTRVLQEVSVLHWNFKLVQYGRSANRLVFNTSVNVCDFWSNMKRVRIIGNIADFLLKGHGAGNMSLSCPLAVGTYVMRNIQVPPDMAALRIFYRPNTLFGLFGNVYAQLANLKMALKCSYEINGTILKTC